MNRWAWAFGVTLSALTVAFAAPQSAAQSNEEDVLRIVVNEGRIEPIRIAFAPFEGAGDQLRQWGEQVREVALADLVNSQLFTEVPRDAFIEAAPKFAARPRFVDWRLINAQWLVTGELGRDEERLLVRFRLWDVLGERQATGLQLTGDSSSWRRFAHRMADAVYSEVTGEGPYFDSRVAFVEETGPKNNRSKSLAIMDQDGANVRYLQPTGELSMTPKFSPSRQELLYISFASGRAEVYRYHLETADIERLGAFEGMNFAPRFAADGRTVAMSFADRGNTDIYLMDIETRALTRLTNHPALDTAPSFSPDGSRVAFESNRAGGQQLYVMNADGTEQERISFGEGSYATPAWSPRGDLIAFTKQHQGRFHIGLMRPDGSGERILTEGYHNEGPSWAPNGRLLVFFREYRDPDRLPSLYTVDVTGAFIREIKIEIPPGAGASDPSWSSILE